MFLVIQGTWMNDGRFFKQLFKDENVFCKWRITHYNKICISIKYVYLHYENVHKDIKNEKHTLYSVSKSSVCPGFCCFVH